MTGSRPEDGNGGASPPVVAVCESCGAPEDDLVPVHRVYLDTDGQGRVIGSRALDDVEQWCLVCRTHYPHEDLSSP